MKTYFLYLLLVNIDHIFLDVFCYILSSCFIIQVSCNINDPHSGNRLKLNYHENSFCLNEWGLKATLYIYKFGIL